MQVQRKTYVPDHNGLLLPFDSDLEVRSVRNMIVQEFEQSLTFFLLITYYVASDLHCCQDTRILIRSGSRYSH